MNTSVQLPAPVFCQAFHPTRLHYAAGCIDGTVRLYNHDARCTKFDISNEKKESVSCRAMAFGEEYLLYGLRNGESVIMSIKGFVEALRTPAHVAAVMSVAWFSDELFCIGYEDGLIRIYNRTFRHPLKAEIKEFSEPVNAIKLHPDGDKFYAIAGGQLGLFDIKSQSHGTRLIAMSDANDEDIESLELFEGGKKIVCACADFGLAIFFEGDLGTHKDRLGGLRYPLHSVFKLRENFLLAGGETGQLLVGQLYPNRWIGVCDELKVDIDVDEEYGEEDDNMMSIDSIVSDCNNTVVALIDNCLDTVFIRDLNKAHAICEGESIGQKTQYAEFMDEL